MSGQSIADYDEFAALIGGGVRAVAGRDNSGVTASQSLVAMLSRTPEGSQTRFQQAVELEGQERWNEAEDLYRQAIAEDAGHADAWLNLGVVLRRLGRRDEAMDCFRQAITLRPDFAMAWVNLGYDLGESGRPVEGSACHLTALHHAPALAAAHHYLAITQRKLGQTEGARASFERAADLAPEDAEALFQLGGMLFDQCRMIEALSAVDAALARQSSHAEAHLLKGAILRQLGEIDAAVASLASAVALQPDSASAQSNYLFAVNCQPEASSETLRQLAKNYGANVERSLSCAGRLGRFDNWPNTADPEKRLRVGLVSGDFWNHPVGYFLENVLRAIDGSRFALYAYANQTRYDDLTGRLQSIVSNWRDVSAQSDPELCEQVRADSIDILVDLSGHTAGNRLPAFSAKPAPVQVAWLGYFASTGISAIDYVLTDACMAPPHEQIPFVEMPWRLPNSFACFSPPLAGPEVGPLPALTLGQVTLACFNNPAKLTDRVLACWSRIFAALPGARLALMGRLFDDPRARDHMLARCARNGLDTERVVLEGATHREGYLQRYRDVDFALDPFPYTGGTTTVEALWMGVPVLTLHGDRVIARQGASLLRSAGLEEWIAGSESEYVDKAILWATDLRQLAALRAHLRPQLLSSPVCDAPLFATHIEEAWRNMWRIWCAGRLRPAPT